MEQGKACSSASIHQEVDLDDLMDVSLGALRFTCCFYVNVIAKPTFLYQCKYLSTIYHYSDFTTSNILYILLVYLYLCRHIPLGYGFLLLLLITYFKVVYHDKFQDPELERLHAERIAALKVNF